jgi:two-component system cell cycle sensor histidine kinase/response regulator CckA
MTSPLPEPSETILVVDDDSEVLALAVDILQRAGYTVLSTADPHHALRLARTHTEPIHLLLTDVVMPLMNGLQLAEEVRVLRPEVKILLMSVYRTKEIEDYRMQLGLQGLFLDKPFTVAGLLEAVRSLSSGARKRATSWPVRFREGEGGPG